MTVLWQLFETLFSPIENLNKELHPWQLFEALFARHALIEKLHNNNKELYALLKGPFYFITQVHVHIEAATFWLYVGNLLEWKNTAQKYT